MDHDWEQAQRLYVEREVYRSRGDQSSNRAGHLEAQLEAAQNESANLRKQKVVLEKAFEKMHAELQEASTRAEILEQSNTVLQQEADLWKSKYEAGQKELQETKAEVERLRADQGTD